MWKGLPDMLDPTMWIQQLESVKGTNWVMVYHPTVKGYTIIRKQSRGGNLTTRLLHKEKKPKGHSSQENVM